MQTRTYVSECVTNAHPDKMADVIADSILDYAVNEDPNTRSGIEVLIKDNTIVLGGELSTKATVPFNEIVRNVVDNYNFPVSHHLTSEELNIINLIGVQSSEINAGVDREDGEIGAGDQGFVVGYSTSDSKNGLPVATNISRQICNRLTELHKVNPKIGPDAKSQVVVEYDEDTDKTTIKSILVSTMHSPDLSIEEVRKYVLENVIKVILVSDWSVLCGGNVNLPETIIINPCGAWHIGGPVSDCGVTGRKIVVDAYGGYCNVGGGAYSGKDLSKVDRSAAYLARFIANVIVNSGIAKDAKVEISYMISVPNPSSFEISITPNGNDHIWGVEIFLREWFEKNVSMTPAAIINEFGQNISFADLAKYGHYGDYSPFGHKVVRPWESETKILPLSRQLRQDFEQWLSES